MQEIDGSERAEYLVVVPANPVDTGQADVEGAAFVWEATTKAAQERLDATLEALNGDGLTVTGELGDYRPLVALDKAMRDFRPDHGVISTHPEDRSSWLRHGVVADARERYDVPSSTSSWRRSPRPDDPGVRDPELPTRLVQPDAAGRGDDRRSRSTRSPASLPGEPMTQPPGWVPDPHW